MATQVKELKEISSASVTVPAGWRLRAVVNDDNMTYFAWNETSREALVVDPMREDWDALIGLCAELNACRFLAVIDTHTHADHVSCAARLAEHLGVPLVMSEKSPSRRIHLRVSLDLAIPTASGPLKLLTAPGHTPDGIVPVWGPFVFTGDTILHGDVGRDDLPGGDPEAHYETVRKLKEVLPDDAIVLPGHDSRGGRATSWKEQVGLNASLTQDRETFVRECAGFVGQAPKAFKESLFENFK